MSIPLIQEATKDAINTSIIAIKRNIERINMLLGLVDNDSPDLSGFATKQELQDAVTELQPVDEVTLGNMQSVSSDAVAESLSYSTTEQKTGGVWIDGKPIYKTVIDIGALPNNSSKTVVHNIQNLKKVLDLKIIANDTVNYIVFDYGTGVSVYVNAIRISVSTDLDYSRYNGYAILEYTKTTD